MSEAICVAEPRHHARWSPPPASPRWERRCSGSRPRTARSSAC